MLNEAKEIVKQPSIWPVVIGAISNPIVCAVGAGLVGGLIIKKVFTDDEAEETVKNGSEPLNKPLETVEVTGNKRLGEPLEDAVHEPLGTVLSEEDIRKEMIRQTMSELGRRSGEARRRKRDMQ